MTNNLFDSSEIDIAKIVMIIRAENIKTSLTNKEEFLT